MKKQVPFLIVSFLCFFLDSCTSDKTQAFTAKTLLNSDVLRIEQISENAFIHTSFLQTEDFGRVPCNGLIVRNGQEVAIFDTPTNDSVSRRLIQWVQDSLRCKISAVVPTHFHVDCLGGLNAFHQQNIPSFALKKTVELANKNKYLLPQTAFTDSLRLLNGQVLVRFFGQGHTCDNVVAYFPQEEVLFGGCLIKELKANKGYLGDANENAWPGTVRKIKLAFPRLKLVVPGHGAYGNTELLDYTIQLFDKK